MNRIVRKLVRKVDRSELRAATTFVGRSRLARFQFEVRIVHGRAMTLQTSRNSAGTVTPRVEFWKSPTLQADVVDQAVARSVPARFRRFFWNTFFVTT